jgi:hypothetical protein
MVYTRGYTPLGGVYETATVVFYCDRCILLGSLSLGKVSTTGVVRSSLLPQCNLPPPKRIVQKAISHCVPA